MIKRNALLTLLLTVVLLCFSGCGKKADSNTPAATLQPVNNTVATEPETTVEPTTQEVKPVTIKLSAVGDMLMHGGVSAPAVQADGSYNYDYLFANLHDKISGADLAVVNNEVVMGGNEKGNIGYPMFNVRTELANGEANAGFDVALLATNHSLDQNASGLLHTMEYWQTNFPDVSIIGANPTPEDAAKICVRNVNGINVALLNYTYGTNGIPVPEGYEYILNYMTEGTKDRIADDIKKAKEMADFVIVFPHWGTEYNLSASEEQKQWASFFANQGVDLVIGTHPHVIEPIEWVEGKDGHKTLVYYSLGNFVSLQYYNFSMLGGLAEVEITKDASGTHISSYDMEFLVTHYTGNRSSVTTYLLDEYTDELAAAHSIHTEPGSEYTDINSYYPVTVAVLKSIAKSVCPEQAKDY